MKIIYSRCTGTIEVGYIPQEHVIKVDLTTPFWRWDTAVKVTDNTG